MFSRIKGSYRAVIVAALITTLLGGGYAVAQSGLVTGQQIKNNTVKSKDIRNKTVQKRDVSKKLLQRLKAIAGAAGASGAAGVAGAIGITKVTSLSGSGFEATNGSCGLNPDGFACGPYADGGASGGSLYFNGLNGKSLSSVKNLVYVARYVADGDTGGVGVPYLRIFLNNDSNDAIFSPNTQPPDSDIGEGPVHEWIATSGLWRYDDDAGAGGEYGVNGAPFSDVVADHGSDTISGIYITTGFSAGTNLASLIRSLEVNGTTYDFG